MYFNLSGIFLKYTITSAEMSSNSIITAAIVSQKFKVLTFCGSTMTFSSINITEGVVGSVY